MACSVRYSATAPRQLNNLDRETSRRIVDALDEIGTFDDPRSRGEALTGDRAGIRRYRVGDHRVLCELRDAALVILAVEIGPRSTIHRR